VSKLDGNERWKTKMLLTEHKEQYTRRHQPQLSGMPSSDELTMIRDGVVLPHILSMLHHGIEQVKGSNLVLKELHARCLEIIVFAVTKDHYALKKKLAGRNIRIANKETDDDIFYYNYVCRGYESRFGITREVLRSEIGQRLAKYTNELKSMMKEKQKEQEKE